jgi:nitronate monooxygenase
VRQLDWPPQYNERTLSNPFCDGWHGNESELLSSLPDAVRTFEAGVAAEDFNIAAMFVGEAIGRINDVRPAADIVADMAAEGYRILNGENRFNPRSVEG